MKPAGIQITCPTCNKTWIICKRCYRGHKYCSHSCKKVGFRKQRKTAQVKYAASLKGRLNQSKRQYRYRIRKKLIILKSLSPKLTNKVTHKSIKRSYFTLKSIGDSKSCYFCGVKISTLYHERDWDRYLIETNYFPKR